MIDVAVLADAEGVLCKVINKPQLEPVIEALLQNLDFLENHKKAFEAVEKTYGHTIMYTMHDGLCFLCAAEEDMRQRVCFSFLDSLMREWFANHLGKRKSGTFEQFMQGEIEFYSFNPDADRIRGLQDKISDITDIMQENLQGMMMRSEKNEVIQKKAERVQDRSEVFRLKTEQVKCQQCVYDWCPCCCCCYCLCRCCWESERCADCTIL
eukprot:TRINITY_DN8785_c0_g1_i1.p1 TRINITY_DN8785_c0_g1~~TRINITY_DN8785_c0_g1_i1.p1  ORF type:complete len:210 (+),score=83.19 TRINITY_DN8785_c0_g1_i1:232-861(+)